jgi:hypothetical protein
MTDPTFSERHGFSPQPAPITIRQDAPRDLRGFIPRVAYDCGFRPTTLRPLVCTATLRGEDPNNWTEYPNIEGEVRDILDHCDWFEVYDIIEQIAATLKDWDERFLNDRMDRVEAFTSRINRLFSKHGIGWQLLDGRIEVRGEEVFEVVARPTIEALEGAGLATTADQIHEALKDLSRRPEPDITGAIQHAMAAVECLARTVTGDKGTLGVIIKKYPTLLPRPLDEGIDKLWGFASERGRHLHEGRAPSYEEAELVVTVAAAVVSYLKHKLDSADARAED